MTHETRPPETRMLPFSEVPKPEAPPRASPAEDRLAAEAVSFLTQFSLLDDRIRCRLRYQAHLKSLAFRGDLAASAVIRRLAETEDALDRDIDRLVDLKDLILQLLGRLSRPEAARLLAEIYLNGRTVSQAAAQWGYSRRTAYRLRRKGLAELGSLLTEGGRKSSA